MPRKKHKLPKKFLRNGKQLKRFSRQAKKGAQETWKYLSQAQFAPADLAVESSRALAVSALGSYLMLSPFTTAPPLHILPKPSVDGDVATSALAETKLVYNPQLLTRLLESLLSTQPQPLTPQQEKQILDTLNRAFEFRVTAELDGHRLNTSYGQVGIEQHLRRYPGDQAENHLNFVASGIAPRLGAWGFFAPSAIKLTPDLVEKEKYYLAIQTFLSPGWSHNSLATKDWFQFRKMLVVNPATGQAAVAVVADAGPATWTGKQFGGSPEVMAALGLDQGPRCGPVLVFFIDDPSDTVPLGPVVPGSSRS